MTVQQLRLAGVLAMTSAILTIPALLLSYHLATTGMQVDHVLLATLELLGLVLFTAIMLLFKKLLNSHFLYHKADNYCDFLVTTYIFFTAANISSLFLPSLQDPLDLFSLLLACAMGIAQIFLGFTLFRLPGTLYGMLKPYCILTITTGILVTSIVLLPIAMLVGAISDVMLGTIFFHAAAAPQAEDQQP